MSIRVVDLEVICSRSLLAVAPIEWALDRLVSRGLLGKVVVSVTSDPRARPVTTATLLLDDVSPCATDVPEAYELDVEQTAEGPHLTMRATDARGWAYGLTDLAERLAAEGVDGLDMVNGGLHTPANRVRSICRPFSNVDHDLAWFRDRSFWPEYLDHLATQRFNRFHLAFGMHLNFGPGLVGTPQADDNYLCFAYPFLIDVPGHSVRVLNLSGQERQRNLDALRFIGDEVHRRGMYFQVGLWNQAYDYGGAVSRYPMSGIGAHNHYDYCAAAVCELVRAVPQIDGLTFRVHYEGGIPDHEGPMFWSQMFESLGAVERTVDLDLHSKGLDARVLDSASRLRGTVTVSPKFSAEHMGLPYHQASIRAFEGAIAATVGREMMGTSEFGRRFTRYGYADFMAEDRAVDVVFRVWPGTQRLLLWGDPAMAAGLGRSGSFAGAQGIEICEPLSFKGRKNSGTAQHRDPYVDDRLRLSAREWRKYEYTYLLFGRLLYDPNEPPATWRRLLQRDFGDDAQLVERALASLSRVLPLVTSAHLPSASNNSYWPEIYTDLPISRWLQAPWYSYDTPQPPNWSHASPLDPAMFYGVDEFVRDSLSRSLSGRYTPLEVAAWLDQCVDDAEAALASASSSSDHGSAHARRVFIDLKVLSRLGRFFAGKFRAAVAYSLFEHTGSVEQLAVAIEHLDAALVIHGSIHEVVADVYAQDLTFGDRPTERGCWESRRPAMIEDLRLLRLELQRASSECTAGAGAVRPLRAARPSVIGVDLVAAEFFTHGEPFVVELSLAGTVRPRRAVLWCRPVDQSATYRAVEMTSSEGRFVAVVPIECTTTRFPLMFFAEVWVDEEDPVLVPGFDEDWSNQPYVVVPSRPTTN